MKIKKSAGQYILISCALVVCLTGATIIGINLFTDKTVKIPDLQTYTKDEVFEWVNKNNISDLITYEYDYSEDIEEGMVISQSIDPKTAIEDNFTVLISKGSIIDLDVKGYKTKDEFNKFISKYPKVTVKYEESDETSETSEIVSFSKNSIDIKSDLLTVFISKPKDEVIDNKDDDTSKKVLVPSNLLGVEEEKFIKTMNDLGFKNLKKDTQKYYSFKSKKDTIFSYDEGKFDTKREIKYAISLGDYVTDFKNTDYNGKTLADAKKIVEKYNELNAHITLTTVNKEVANDSLIDKLSDCNCKKDGTKSIVTCNLGVKSAKTENVESYAGKKESDMITALKAKGFTNFNKTASKYSQYAVNYIISNDTGNKKISDTINYTVSLGVYSPNVNEFNGKTLADARALASDYTSKGAKVEIANPQPKEIEGKPNNTLQNCAWSDASGKYLFTCDLVVNVEKYAFPSEHMLKTNYSKTSYNDTVNALKGLLDGKFTNWHIEPVTDAIAVGQISNVKVDGQDSYTEGWFKANTEIIIYVVQTQE